VVLQPFSAFKNPLSETEAAFDLYKYREQQMKHLYEATHDQLRALADKDNVPYLDGRYIYNGISDTIFTDDVHLTDLGYQLLAQRIATKLKSEIVSVDSICGSEVQKSTSPQRANHS
jgi:hypothetical protein